MANHYSLFHTRTDTDTGITYEVHVDQEDVNDFHEQGYDESFVRHVQGELDRGNELAWCRLTVVARVQCGSLSFEGRDPLGRCSLDDENEILTAVEECGLEEGARSDLRHNLAKIITQGKAAEAVLAVLKEGY